MQRFYALIARGYSKRLSSRIESAFFISASMQILLWDVCLRRITFKNCGFSILIPDTRWKRRIQKRKNSKKKGYSILVYPGVAAFLVAGASYIISWFNLNQSSSLPPLDFLSRQFFSDRTGIFVSLEWVKRGEGKTARVTIRRGNKSGHRQIWNENEVISPTVNLFVVVFLILLLKKLWRMSARWILVLCILCAQQMEIEARRRFPRQNQSRGRNRFQIFRAEVRRWDFFLWNSTTNGIQDQISI